MPTIKKRKANTRKSFILTLPDAENAGEKLIVGSSTLKM